MQQLNKVFSRTSISILFAWVVVLLAPAIFFLPANQGNCFTYGDASSYFLHLNDLYRSAWLEGAIFWSDKIMAGYPTLGNPQVGLFYLPNLPILAMDPFQAVRFQIVLHGYILVIGAFLLARKWNVRRWWSVAIACQLLASGTLVSLVSMLNNWMAVAWIPWIVLACMNLDQSRGKIFFFVALHMFLGAGEPQLAFLLYPILAISLITSRGWKASLIPVGLMVLSGTTQPWLLSFLESVQRSSRQMGLVTMQDLPWVLDRALALSFWAPSSIFRSEGLNGWMTLNGAIARPNWILSIHTGGVLLVWAVWGVWSNRSRTGWFVLGAMACLMVASVGKLPGGISIESLPIFHLIRYPIRYWILVHLGIFGFAAQGMAKDSSDHRMTVLFAAAVILGEGLLIGTLYQLHPYHHKTSELAYFIWKTLIEGQIWLEVVLMCLMVLAIAFREKLSWGMSIIIGVSAAFAFAQTMSQVEYSPRSRFELRDEYHRLGISKGLWFVNDGNFTRIDSNRVRKSQKWIDSLQRSNPGMLTRTSSRDLFSSSTMYHNGIRSWGVVLELFPRVVQGYYRFLSIANGEELTNLLWLLGIDNVLGSVSSRSGEIPMPGGAKLLKVIAGPYDVALVWKLPPGLGMMSVLDTVIPDSNFNRLMSWSARDSGTLGITEGVPCQGGTGQPKWERLGPSRWLAHAAGIRGILVLRQAIYPGWTVLVDGKRRSPTPVDLLYGGVCLDGSQKNVEFRFRPRLLLPSIFLVGVSLIGLAFLIIWKMEAVE